jgi:hypothetical protein
MKSIALFVCMFWMATACTVESGMGGDDDDDDDDIVADVDAGGGGNNADAGDGEECPTQAMGTAGTHIVAEVSWSATTGVKAGSGQLHIWTRSVMSFDGNDVTAQVSPCGSKVPEVERSELLGGGKVLLEVPPEVWDAAEMPTFNASGSISGFNAGATIMMDPVASLVGATMSDPMGGSWPASGQELSGVDHDGSGYPGITSKPKDTPPYTLPPVDLIGAIIPTGERADQLYIATRSIVQLSGTRSSCESASGSATISAFDTHVVGCHLKSGSQCSAAQAGFVDENRMLYQIDSASYTMTRVDDGASCADVRAALP